MFSDATPSSELLSVINNVPFGLLLFEDSGAILDLNTTLLDWLGYAREDLVGRHLDSLLPAGGRIFYQTHLFPLLRSAGAVSELYFALRTRDGSELPVLLNARREATRERPTNIISFVVINNRQQFEGALLHAWHAEQAAREESERKSQALDRLNVELEKKNADLGASEERLRESNESKDEFIGLVAHELKNPLGVLTGTFALLTRSPRVVTEQEAQEIMTNLHLEFRRLISVIDNLLIIARSEVKTMVDLEPVIVSRVVDAVVSRHRSLSAFHPISVETEPGTPLALASSNMTEQILDNLIGNAAKYGAAQTPIDVNVRRSDGNVLITVTNEGEELSTEDVDRFFQAFYRHPRHRQKTPGVGLGLTVCQRLADAQYGTISALPRPGGGLKVSLFLPAVAEAS